MDPVGSADKGVTLQVASLVTRIVTETGSSSPFEDVALNTIRAASERDPDIQALKQAITKGFQYHKYEVDPQIRPYWSERDKLSVDDNLVICLVVPNDHQE